MDRTILLSVSDVVLVDEEVGMEIRTRRLRFGRLRVFALSILLGIAIGAMLCVVEPERSKEASLRVRGALRAARSELQGASATVMSASATVMRGMYDFVR